MAEAAEAAAEVEAMASDRSVTARRIYLFLTILWMIVIFIFSSRDSLRSGQDSRIIGRVLCQVFVAGFDSLSQEDQAVWLEKMDHPVRKAAHFTEYMILGFLMSGVCFPRPQILSWAAGSAYAATDEYHQTFISGRSGQISDILIDASGVAVGICLHLAWFRLRAKKHREEE